MRHLDELINATNQILGSERVSPEKLREIFRTGCRTLTMLSDDEEFFADLKLVEADKPLREDIRGTFDNLKRFEQFVEFERKALHEAGIAPEVEKFLIEQAREVRQQLPNWRADPETIRTGINKLRNETCNTAELLKNSRQVEERFASLKSLGRRVGFVLGGSAVLGINAQQFFTGNFYGAASIQVGNKLISKGFD